jgi:hypothetical protein
LNFCSARNSIVKAGGASPIPCAATENHASGKDKQNPQRISHVFIANVALGCMPNHYHKKIRRTTDISV